MRLNQYAGAVGVVAVLGLTAVSSQGALLTYDLRVAESGNSAGVVRLNAKEVQVTAPGDKVVLELYGVLDDGDLDGSSTNDGIQVGRGSFLSSAGGLLGNLSSATLPSNFQGIGAQGGSAVDLDNDGDLDVGNTATAVSTTGFFNASSTATSGGLPTYIQGTSLLLGTVEFLVTSATGGTTLNFVPAAFSSGVTAQRNVHNFTIDGTSYLRGNSALTNIADVGAGSAVSVTVVPEPGAVGLLVLTAAAVGLRRRER